MTNRGLARPRASPPGNTGAYPVEDKTEQESSQRDGTTEALGRSLRTVRRAKGLPLQRVEGLTDGEFKASVLGAYERGERAVSLLRLQRLAEFYGVGVDELLPHTTEAATEGYRLDVPAGEKLLTRGPRWVQTRQHDPSRGEDTGAPVRLSVALADMPSTSRKVFMVIEHVEILETMTMRVSAWSDDEPGRPAGTRTQPGATLIAVAGELAEVVRSSLMLRSDQSLYLRALVAIAEATYAASNWLSTGVARKLRASRT